MHKDDDDALKTQEDVWDLTMRYLFLSTFMLTSSKSQSQEHIPWH